MAGIRIQFPVDDAARFNALRDQWRSAASGCALSKAGLRVAAVLPNYVSREYGYAFPTDEQIASDIQKDVKTAKRGLTALDDAALIERVLKPKFGERGKVVGKLRRIYLCMPTEGTFSQKPKGQNDDEPKGHLPKGQVEPKGQKSTTEGTYGCPYILDSNTPDKKIRSEEEVHVYVPVREGYPKGYLGDDEFLNAFDRTVMEMTDGRQIAAGEFETIIEQAFDRTTKSSEGFMPFYWVDVCALNSNDTQNWFRRRTGQIIHRRAA